MDSRSRSRKLKYQQTLLKEEAYRYNKQKSLLPVLLILAAFSVLFTFLYFINLGGGKTILTKKGVEDSKTITIPEKGLYSLSFTNGINPIYKATSKSIKSEIIVEKEGKKLYHFFIDNPSTNSFEKQQVQYFFRTPGDYSIKTIHHARALVDNAGNVVSSSELVVREANGNNALILWGMRLFILATVIILLLKDYFGNPKNYKKIIENKEINWKISTLAPLVVIASMWLAGGYYILQSGYGYAGYRDDMHAPAKKVQIEYNYYVN